MLLGPSTLLALFCSATRAGAQTYGISAVQATLTTGSGTTRTGTVADTSLGTVGDSATLNFAGNNLAVTQVTANGAAWNVQSGGTLSLRRSGTSQRTLGWYFEDSARTGSAGSYTYNLGATFQSSETALLSGNNLLAGTDNIFVNSANPSSNMNTIERVDVLFPAGITISSSLAFTIYDRGATGVHDSLRVAGVTALGTVNGDAQAPTNYGTVLDIASASYGANQVVNLNGGGTYDLSNRQYVIMRNAGSLETDDSGTADNLSGYNTQGIGGVLIPSTSLGAVGSTIYGFSMFGGDVTGSGASLADWKNASAYPTNSPDSTGGQGLDLVGASSSLMVAAVPEPGSLALLALPLLDLPLRRRR